MREVTNDNPLKKEADFMAEEGPPVTAEELRPTAGQKILVVDDEPALLRLLEFLLVRQGYTVLTATNGNEALTLLRQERPDLIVLDVMMPHVDGYAVAAAVRAEPEIAATPIVMLTAKAQGGDVERGLAVGVDAYITKPFEPERLSRTIAGYLRRVPATNAVV